MNPQLIIVLLLLVAAVVMFMRNRPRMDVVALLMIAALPFTGVITISEAIAGFSDPNIVLIALLFVLGRRPGAHRRRAAPGRLDQPHVRRQRVRLVVLLMASVAIMGSIMSSTAIVAIFIPVVLRICQSTGTAPSRLMMPLSVAALISGMMTLVATTPNLIVNAELLRQGKPGFEFFTITPMGITVLVLGIAYMLFARRWLPDAKPGAAGAVRRPSFRDWIERYELAGREVRVRIKPDSPLVGRPLESSTCVPRASNCWPSSAAPAGCCGRPPTTELRAGDILLLDIIASSSRSRNWSRNIASSSCRCARAIATSPTGRRTWA
jgi:di/tricarboxylate transporter